MTTASPSPRAILPQASVTLATLDNGRIDAPVINGVTWDNVTSIGFFASVDKPLPTLVLEARVGKADFEGEAEVQFFDPEDADSVRVTLESIEILSQSIGHDLVVEDGTIKVAGL